MASPHFLPERGRLPQEFPRKPLEPGLAYIINQRPDPTFLAKCSSKNISMKNKKEGYVTVKE